MLVIRITIIVIVRLRRIGSRASPLPPMGATINHHQTTLAQYQTVPVSGLSFDEHR